MGKVSVVTAAEAQQGSLRNSKSADSKVYRKAKYDVDKLPYFPSQGETLQLFQIDLGPSAEVAPHAHTEDEIIYLLRGEIRLGAKVLTPGDALHVTKDTLYGFSAGPDGCSFLNFRPTDKVALLTKDQFLARRKGA